MKYIFSLFLILCSFCGHSQNIPDKWALLIGISKYPKNSTCNWGDLAGHKSVDSTLSVLSRKGFSGEKIMTVTDAQATKQGIETAFANLTRQINPGAVVYVYFSMHGQQIPDDNGDEGPDNLDECLIPFDCPLYSEKKDKCPFPDDYNGSRHLRDDEIGELLTSLRKKMGSAGQVMLVMDACHAGTGTRNTSGKDNNPLAPFRLDNVVPVETHNVGASSSSLAPMISFFAQLPNVETTDQDFTNIVLKVLNESSEKTTYEDFFQKVQTKVSNLGSYITPTHEDAGNLYKTPMLGGGIKGYMERIAVKKWLNQGEVKIGLGTFSSVFANTELEFFNSKDKLIATGKVSKSYPNEAYIDITPRNIPEKEFIGAWGRISKWVVADEPLLLKIEGFIPDVVKKNLSDNQNFIFNDTATIRIREGKYSLLVIRKSDTLYDTLFTISKSKEESEIAVELSNYLLNFQRQETFRTIEYEDTTLRVSWKLIPMEKGCKRIENTDSSTDYTTNEYHFAEGQYFGVEITNNTKNDGVYFTLMDFPATQHTKLESMILLPDFVKGNTTTDYFLAKGATWSSKDICWKITPPLGKERLRLFTSTKPIQNLQQAVQMRSSTRVLEQIDLADRYNVSDIYLNIKTKKN